MPHFEDRPMVKAAGEAVKLIREAGLGSSQRQITKAASIASDGNPEVYMRMVKQLIEVYKKPKRDNKG